MDVEEGAELAPAAGERVSAATSETQEISVQQSVRSLVTAESNKFISELQLAASDRYSY